MIKLASFKSKELLWIIKSISSKPTQTIINMDGLIGVLLITIKLKANGENQKLQLKENSSSSSLSNDVKYQTIFYINE